MALLFDETQGSFQDTGSQTSPTKKNTGLMRKEMGKLDEVAPRGHTLAYITPEEAKQLNANGGGLDNEGKQMLGPYGIPMYSKYKPVSSGVFAGSNINASSTSDYILTGAVPNRRQTEESLMASSNDYSPSAIIKRIEEEAERVQKGLGSQDILDLHIWDLQSLYPDLAVKLLGEKQT